MFNFGFIFFAFVTSTYFSIITSWFYLFSYLLSVIGIFSIFLVIKLRTKFYNFEEIKTLYDLGLLLNSYKSSHKLLGLFLLFFFLSVAGVPPFIGFLGKYLLLVNLVY